MVNNNNYVLTQLTNESQLKKLNATHLNNLLRFKFKLILAVNIFACKLRINKLLILLIVQYINLTK